MVQQQPFTDHFAQLAQEYDQWFQTPLGQFVAQQERALLYEALKDHPPGVVLEIGAGTGFATTVLLQLGWEVVAVEPSDAMRAIGMHKLPDIEWVAARAEHLPFPSEKFDIVLAFTVIEFVQDLSLFFHEAFRVLVPSGSLYIGFFEPESPWVALYRHLGDRGHAPWTTARFYDQEQLEERAGKRSIRKNSVLWLAPYATPPFPEADAAGKRAGNVPAVSIIQWKK